MRLITSNAHVFHISFRLNLCENSFGLLYFEHFLPVQTYRSFRSGYTQIIIRLKTVEKPSKLSDSNTCKPFVKFIHKTLTENIRRRASVTVYNNFRWFLVLFFFFRKRGDRGWKRGREWIKCELRICSLGKPIEWRDDGTTSICDVSQIRLLASIDVYDKECNQYCSTIRGLLFGFAKGKTKESYFICSLHVTNGIYFGIQKWIRCW